MRPAFAVSLAFALVALTSTNAAAAPRKVGVLALEAGAGVDKKVAAAVTDAVAGAVAKRGVDVVTEAQLKALLDHAAKKQLTGCTDDACMAQIGEALGVDALVTGSLAKVGASWLVALRMVEVSTGVGKLADRRLKGGSLDDVLDALPALVGELAGAAVPATAAVPTGAPVTAPVVPRKGPRPASSADVPIDVPAATSARMRAVGDGKGLVIVYDPKPEDSFAPFYVAFPGAPAKLYAQRVSGGGREGDKKFDAVFWEPRAKARWQASFGVDAMDTSAASAWLQCGDKRLALAPVALPAKARFHDARWQRRLIAVARADDGTYFVVDQARIPEDNRDYRLHVGKDGAFATLSVKDAVLDGATSLFLTSEGQLTISSTPTPSASWGAVSLRTLDVESVAGDVYGRLGVYTEALGTPCDSYLH